MTYDQASRLKTVTEKHEPLLIFRMIRIIELARVLIQKRGLSLFEGNTVFCEVSALFAAVPTQIRYCSQHYNSNIGANAIRAAGKCEILTSWFRLHS